MDNYQYDSFKADITTLIGRLTGSPVSEIADNDDLLEGGYIDSLKLTEIIIFVEEKSGQQIDIEHFDLNDFRTLKRIYDIHF